MSAVIPFDFNGARVRVVTVDGEPEFVANDLAKTLGYAEAKDMTRMLDDDHKGRRLVPTPGGTQEMLTVTEPGMYRAIMRSQRPEAKGFERWVTGEVLPQIRKTGRYAPNTDPIVAALQQALEVRRAQIQLQESHDALEKRVTVLEDGGDWLTIKGACNVLGVTLCERDGSVAGRRAAKQTRAAGETPQKVNSQIYGLVGLYPREIALSVVAEMTSRGEA